MHDVCACGRPKDKRASRCIKCAYDPMLRFARKVVVNAATGCWEWRGQRTHNGYGRFRVGPKRILVHRFTYERAVGPIPDGMEIDHLCRNPACCYPRHLEVVTHRENTLRGTSPTADYAAQTHCKRGHEFTPENTYIIPSSGSRQCLTCKRAARAGERERRKARQAAHSIRLGLR
jgi:hypothetical protein